MTRVEVLSAMTALSEAFELVVRDPDYRSRGQGSIPGATRFSEK
jgi:hypothetical protein